MSRALKSPRSDPRGLSDRVGGTRRGELDQPHSPPQWPVQLPDLGRHCGLSEIARAAVDARATGDTQLTRANTWEAVIAMAGQRTPLPPPSLPPQLIMKILGGPATTSATRLTRLPCRAHVAPVHPFPLPRSSARPVKPPLPRSSARPTVPAVGVQFEVVCPASVAGPVSFRVEEMLLLQCSVASW